MNLVIDDAVEVQLATRDGPEKRRQLGKNQNPRDIPSIHIHTHFCIGQILLKGDNVSLIQSLD